MTQLPRRRRRKPSEIEQQQASKQKRIAAMYSREQVDKIHRTEQKWKSLSYRIANEKKDPATGEWFLVDAEWLRKVHQGRMDELLSFEPVHKLIHGAAYCWSRSNRDRRIPFDEFLSAFYEAVWKVIDGYTWATDFYLYETMSKAIQKRGKAILRDCLGADCRKVLHEALPLVDGFEELFSWRSARLF